MIQKYDALLVVSFGGPEGMDDVIPFLDNVLKGRNVPEERKLEVAHHYRNFGGVSPINEQNRLLIKCLSEELAKHSIRIPIYWGNRNWHPFLADAIRKMRDDGIKNGLAFITSAFSSYSGCRQYRENICEARELIGKDSPTIDKLRVYYNHPGFIHANCDRIREAMSKVPVTLRDDFHLAFTAHSLPQGMAARCKYVQQLEEVCSLITGELNWKNWKLVYQSRSGPPSQHWLEPDICDHIQQCKKEGIKSILIVPIGFVSDHMEILFDLDTEARDLCKELDIHMELAKTVGSHPFFIAMIRELIQERLHEDCEKRFLGNGGPQPDRCAQNCCLPF